MVKPAYKASAMALMFMGLSLSNILGVPFGTLIESKLWMADDVLYHIHNWCNGVDRYYFLCAND